MRLKLESFFCHLIFYPFEADTKKERAIALGASLACGFFSIGICHLVCALHNYFTHRSPGKATEQDKRVSEVRDSVMNMQSSNKSAVFASSLTDLVGRERPEDVTRDEGIALATSEEPCAEDGFLQPTESEVTIPSKVKTSLDQLFKGSPYSIDKLPIYPIILDKENHPLPERKNMTAPVMKGKMDDGRPFIVIKVDCDLKDEHIEKYAGAHEEIQNHYKIHRKLEDILMLYQYHTNGPLFWGGEGKYCWNQLNTGKSIEPSFFTWNFTYPTNGRGPTESQKDNFKLVQTLLKTGESPDTKGQLWRIAT